MIETIYRRSFSEEKVIPLTSNLETYDLYCQKFSQWLRSSSPGDKFCYYCAPHIAGSAVGRIAFRAYESGHVTLYQKRTHNQFEYWAEKRRHWIR